MRMETCFVQINETHVSHIQKTKLARVVYMLRMASKSKLEKNLFYSIFLSYICPTWFT